ncbi:hypothetical protein [Fluviibacter phosphoraccumulans]|uniref:hypothetical protein n=1 Tax=Fluviibacter phosphoraccumulans TaxID=1751046 RepID=UPI003D6A0A96
MCANFRPSSGEALAAFSLPPPDFSYGEAYPGSIVPVVTNFAPREWVPGCFGLIPAWAKDAKIARSTYNARTEMVGDPYRRCVGCLAQVQVWRRGQRAMLTGRGLALHSVSCWRERITPGDQR